jgi:hypothetical protein
MGAFWASLLLHVSCDIERGSEVPERGEKTASVIIIYAGGFLPEYGNLKLKWNMKSHKDKHKIFIGVNTTSWSLHAVLTSAPDKGERWTSRSGRFTAEERAPNNH